MVKWNRFLLVLIMGVLLSGSFPILAKDESQPLNEDRSVYQKGFGEMTYLYVTVLNSINEEGIVIPFSDVNSYKYTPEKACPEAKVIVQVGDRHGPLTNVFLGTGTIKVRGKSTTFAAQKSYKIKLEDEEQGWEGQTEINLNKHAYDLTRMRNKLSFDYFKIIPHMTSLRTRFVNLWVKDTTAKKPTGEFIDYGLFTQIEEPGKNFLKAHGLDPKGNLYKANFFEFQHYPDYIKDRDDPTYSKKKFEELLEICGSKDHKKLLEMLDDVNDDKIPIEEIIEKHFNLDNLTTWLAVNIITGNRDTSTQNFMLYSPSDSKTWYFMPWDYDGAWGFYDQLGATRITLAPWKNGLSNYWGMSLFNRMLRIPQYVQAISMKVEYIAAIMNEQNTKKMLEKYHDIVSPFVLSHPDSKALPGGIAAFEFEYRRIAKQTEINHQMFYLEQEKPMPYFLAPPELNEDGIRFYWDESFDLQGDPLTYVFQLSKEPGFGKIIEEKKLDKPEYIMKTLTPGMYYFRVITYDSKGNSQVGFDEYVDARKNLYFGVRQFNIE